MGEDREEKSGHDSDLVSERGAICVAPQAVPISNLRQHVQTTMTMAIFLTRETVDAEIGQRESESEREFGALGAADDANDSRGDAGARMRRVRTWTRRG